MDKVLEVNKEAKTVCVQAGVHVSQLVDALKEHGLTLQNFASIREQQIGGIIQVVELFQYHCTFNPHELHSLGIC
jgi:L-galactono-1,4-lactone dehydrogenase